jgi:hypothetical protein
LGNICLNTIAQNAVDCAEVGDQMKRSLYFIIRFCGGIGKDGV